MDLESRVTGIVGHGLRGEIIFELEPEGRPEAPQGHKLMRRGFRWRDVRTVAIGLKPIELRDEGAAMVEHDDGRGIRAVPPFVKAYTKITRKLGCLIVDLARFMTLSDIAGWLRLSWDTVKAVVKGRLEKDYLRIGYRGVRQIAIDELYLGRTRNISHWSWTWRALVSSGWGKAVGQRLCVNSGVASSSAELDSKRWPWT